MTATISLAPLLERFFTQRLMQQRQVESAHDQFLSRHLPSVPEVHCSSDCTSRRRVWHSKRSMRRWWWRFSITWRSNAG